MHTIQLKENNGYLHISMVRRRRVIVAMSSGFLMQWRIALKPAVLTSELSLNKLGVRLQPKLQKNYSNENYLFKTIWYHSSSRNAYYIIKVKYLTNIKLINVRITHQHIMSYIEKPNISLVLSLAFTDDKSLTNTFNKHNFLWSFKPCVWIRADRIFFSDSLGPEK